jgi:hypothetical protein
MLLCKKREQIQVMSCVAKKIVEILEKIAKNNIFADISDPVEWQRALRQDRSLPRI